MQTRSAFALWPLLHGDILRFLDQVPEGDLDRVASGEAEPIGAAFRHLVEVEDFWRRRILDPDAAMARLAAGDREQLRQEAERIFAATDRLLDASRLDALAERPMKSPYPVKNALEALSLCYLHTVHHRASIAAQLRLLGVTVEEWI